MKRHMIILLALIISLGAGRAVDAAIIVGRIAHVEGRIYRYMDVDQSWVETFLQSPAGSEDIIMTGEESRAEIAFPNDQLVRLDEKTELEILNLDNDSADFILHSGLVRFHNESSTGKTIVETPRGTAKVNPGNIMDVLVENDSVTVSAVEGEAVFHSYREDGEKVDVISEFTSLEFRKDSTIAGSGPVKRQWDRWCAAREGVRSRNSLVRSRHLPESMQQFAYIMEPYGSWQKVYYRGYYYWAWKPRMAAAGWRPFTKGYWHEWRGTPVWIDDNPWGWVTHHYGNWINLQGAWLWTPYIHVAHVPGVTIIGFNIRFGKAFRPHWHPGRVRWITHNDHIGWLPLAPWETYYGYRQWGPRTVVMRDGVRFSLTLNLSGHRHKDHAVVIPKHHLYNKKPAGKKHYRKVRVENVRKKVIVNKYQVLPTAEKPRLRKKSIKGVKIVKAQKRIKGRSGETAKHVKIIRKNRKREQQITAAEHYSKPAKSPAGRRVAKYSRPKMEKRHSGTVENKSTRARYKGNVKGVVSSAKKGSEKRDAAKSKRPAAKNRSGIEIDRPVISVNRNKDRNKRYNSGRSWYSSSLRERHQR